MGKKKTKSLFPPKKRGGYSCRIMFFDEMRGERFFDQGWVVGVDSESAFTLLCGMTYDGRNDLSISPAKTIGPCFKVGESISVQPTQWNMRGGRTLPSRTVRVVAVEIKESSVTISYE